MYFDRRANRLLMSWREKGKSKSRREIFQAVRTELLVSATWKAVQDTGWEVGVTLFVREMLRFRCVGDANIRVEITDRPLGM